METGIPLGKMNTIEVINRWESEGKPLASAAKELVAADAAFRRMFSMGTSISRAEYEIAWSDFLTHISRTWNKIKSEAHGRKSWQQLKGKYEQLRRKDSLLKYIEQARNVSEHCIAPITNDWDANLRAKSQSGVVSLEWNAWDRPLLPVTNRGTTFNPPKKHLGKPMSHYQRPGYCEPLTVAGCAMRFYVDMFNEVSEKVFPSGLR